LVVKRTYPGVGKIERASGTRDRQLFRRILDMMDVFHREGRYDVLALIRDRKLSPLEAWRHYSTGQWDRIPKAEALESLEDAWSAWLQDHECSEEHRHDLAKALTRLLTLDPKATVAGSIKLLSQYREQSKDKARTFNKTRSAVRRFLEAQTGKYSHLWLEAARIQPLTVAPKLYRASLLPDEAVEVRRQLKANAGDMWWTLCTTGMRVRSEYLAGRWRVEGNAVIIETAKQRGGLVKTRMVPVLWPPMAPQLSYFGFRTALDTLPRKLAAHDARRTFTRWLTGAGIERIRREIYLGHGPRNVTDLYEWHEVQRHLEEDRGRLLEYIGAKAPGFEMVK
jgi:hypothetical protein